MWFCSFECALTLNMKKWNSRTAEPMWTILRDIQCAVDLCVVERRCVWSAAARSCLLGCVLRIESLNCWHSKECCLTHSNSVYLISPTNCAQLHCALNYSIMSKINRKPFKIYQKQSSHRNPTEARKCLTTDNARSARWIFLVGKRIFFYDFLIFFFNVFYEKKTRKNSFFCII